MGTLANKLQWKVFQRKNYSGIFGLTANGSTANVTTAKLRRLFRPNQHKRHTHTLLFNRNLGENVDFSKVKTQAYRQFFASPEKLKKC